MIDHRVLLGRVPALRLKSRARLEAENLPLRHQINILIVAFGERHLRCILQADAAYYNQARPHLSLDKDAPEYRSVQIIGRIVARPILAGLHHRYVRGGVSDKDDCREIATRCKWRRERDWGRTFSGHTGVLAQNSARPRKCRVFCATPIPSRA